MKHYYLILAALLLLAACKPSETCNSPNLTPDQCWFEKATSNKQITLCDNIADTVLEETCQSTVAISTQSLENCANLSTKVKAACTSTISQHLLLAEECNKVEDGHWRDVCMSFIGINTSTHPLCKTVGNQKIRDDCYTQISVNKEDERVCSYVTEDSTRNECYRKHAYSRLNPALCALNEPEFEEDICIRKVALLANDSTICSQIGYVKIRENCQEKFMA